jgi:coenzyme F420-reducing hydrogenase beta subunit
MKMAMANIIFTLCANLKKEVQNISPLAVTGVQCQFSALKMLLEPDDTTLKSTQSCS